MITCQHISSKTHCQLITTVKIPIKLLFQIIFKPLKYKSSFMSLHQTKKSRLYSNDSKGWCKRENIAAETVRPNVAHKVEWVSKEKETKTLFASKAQNLCLQNMLLGYANKETIATNSKSVFLWCFPNVFSYAASHNLC